MAVVQSQVVKDVQQELFTIRLNALVSTANASAVAATLAAVLAILEEAERQLEIPHKIQIKARAFAPGSFQIPLELIVGGLTLYAMAGAPYFEDIIKVFKGYFELKKLFKGNPPPENATDGAVVVEGNTFNLSNSVLNVYLNAPVNQAVSRAAVELDKDDQVTSLEFLKGEELEQIELIKKDDLRYLKGPDTSLVLDPKTSDLKKKKVKLVIRKPVLCESKDKWSFLYGMRPISADIVDEVWLKKVNASLERFATGDRLIVDLIIHREWNPALNVYEARRYTIEKVHNHELHKPDHQLLLEFKAPKKQAKKKSSKKMTPAKTRGKANTRKQKNRDKK